MARKAGNAALIDILIVLKDEVCRTMYQMGTLPLTALARPTIVT